MLENNLAVTPIMPDARRKGRARMTTFTRVDGRSVAGKRHAALVKMWRAALGGDVSPHVAMLIEHAATAVVVSEHASARMMAGDPITPEQVVKLANVATRAVNALNLPNGHKPERGDDALPTRVIGRAK
jgi:hypothetical protein